MRKAEREIARLQDKFDTLLRCEYMTLALSGAAPYAVPLNFGAELCGGELRLYFHCAKEGEKLVRLRRDPSVAFCAARQLRVFCKGAAPCGYTTDYESVCGEGRAEILRTEEERLHGLQVLMAHYAAQDFPQTSFAPRALALCEVVCVRVHAWTGKRLIRPQVD